MASTSVFVIGHCVKDDSGSVPADHIFYGTVVLADLRPQKV